MIIDESGLFDARGHDLTTSTSSVHRLIVTIDRRVGLSLSRGERVWGRILFCDDEKLGCMVEGDYTALTLIVMIDRHVDLSLSRGERVWSRLLFSANENVELQK